MVLCCEMISQPHSYPLRKSPLAAKMFLFFPMAAKWRNGLRKCFFFPLWLRNDLQASKWLRNDLQASKWLWNDFQASKWVAKMFLFSLWLQNGQRKCFFFSLLLWNGLQTLKWLRNGLQATKIDLRKEGRFVKTSCKANRSCENANRALQTCI